ncbi:16284_t:CDS:2, partial [Gigaspora margarita]
RKSSSLNTIKGYIKYIDNRPVYYVNYGPNFELEIISNHSSSDAATKTQRAINEFKGKPLKQFNELSISTKKAHAKTVGKKIKKDFNQIAKENYYPNNQNIIEKNKHESAIVQIIDKYQISRDGYCALSAIQPNLPRNYAVSNQHTILTSKMANYIPIETFNLSNQDNLLLNEEF